MIKFAFPWGLAILPIVVGLAIIFFIVILKRRQSTALFFSNVRLVKELSRVSTSSWKRWIPFMFDLLILCLMLVIASRPQALVKLPIQGYAVVLVIDISGSMMAKDFKPSRIAVARDAAKNLVMGLKGNYRLGIVAFNDKAKVVLKPTASKRDAILALATLDADYGGTAIGDAIYAGLVLLDSLDMPKKFMILLSDGENNSGSDPLKAAKEAKDSEVTIFTIGIGTARGAMIPGIPYPVRLDEATLKKIASMTGGQYFYAGSSSELYKVFNLLRDQVGFVKKYQDIAPILGAIGGLLVLLKLLTLCLIRASEL